MIFSDLTRTVDAHGNIFYRNLLNQLHSGNGIPSVEKSNGDRTWHINGKIHRDGGLPAVERADGTKEWWVNGILHREGDLPAVMSDTEYRFQYGFLV